MTPPDEPDMECEHAQDGWFPISKATTPGAGTAAVTWQDTKYAFYWEQHVKHPEERAHERRWYPKEPPPKLVIQHEMVASSFHVPDNHFLLKRVKTVTSSPISRSKELRMNT